MQRLDLNSLHLRVYADASFGNNADLTSQLGYLVLLADDTGKCNILHYASYKSRRVMRSVLGAEVYAFADAFNYAYVMKRDLEEMLRQRFPLQLFTDSRNLFDAITKSCTTADHHLMIDIKDVRNFYNNMHISTIGFVRSYEKPADAFTKSKPWDALNRILQTGICDVNAEEWVVRKSD